MYSAEGAVTTPVQHAEVAPAASNGTAALRWCQADPSTHPHLNRTGICHVDAIAPSVAESGWRESPSPLLDPISVNMQDAGCSNA